MARTQTVKQKPAGPGGEPNRLFILGVIAVVVVGLGLVAVVATNRGDGERTTVAVAQTADVSVAGDTLDPLPEGVQVGDASNDPMVGQVAPTLTGTRFDGSEVVIEADGTPKAVYFLAHWCPHCQEEVPVVQDLIDDGQLPANVEVYGVSTAVDDGRGNFPPEEWFEAEGFTPIVIRDDASSSAIAAFGGSSFPYAVYLDGDNRVVARSAGNLPPDTTVQLWELAAAAG